MFYKLYTCTLVLMAEYTLGIMAISADDMNKPMLETVFLIITFVESTTHPLCLYVLFVHFS